MSGRMKNSQRNLMMSVISQLTVLILSFASRTVFIRTLGVDYLGINGLFTNILSVLSLVELGVGTAIVYSMYRPLAEQDHKKLAALTQYYRMLYRNIAVFVLAIGLAIFPFLDYIVQLDTPIENIKLYYLLFLAEAVSSYLIIYKTSIITADQKSYIISKNRLIANVIAMFLQIAVLVTTKNYVIYLLVKILVPFLGNVYNSRVATRMYPFINEPEILEPVEKKKIWNNIKSMFFYKMGGVILNNTDNILVSVMVSTTIVGIYSNYTMLITKINGFTALIFSSVEASLGNLNVNSSAEKKYDIFKVLSLISFWVYSFCAICFCMLFQDFVSIWLGKQYLLSNDVMYVAVINFYLQGVLYPIWCFRQTTGLFRETKYTMLIASAINLILSVILGKWFGLIGIFAATALSRLCTNIWYDPYVLFRKYFKRNPMGYYARELIRVSIIIFLVAIGEMVFNIFYIENIYVRLIVKILYCVAVPQLCFIAVLYRTEEFHYLKKHVIKLFSKRRSYVD